MDIIKQDSLMDAVMEVGSIITLASAKEGVAYAFWNTLEEAEQDAKVAEWEEKIDERAKEIEDSRAEINGSSHSKVNEKAKSKNSKKSSKN